MTRDRKPAAFRLEPEPDQRQRDTDAGHHAKDVERRPRAPRKSPQPS